MAGSRDLILKILGDATGAQKALKEAQHDLKETGDHAEKTGQHFGGLAKFAAVAGGAAGVGILVEGLKGAIEAASAEQVAQTGLDAALKATHQSVKAMAPALEEATAASRKLGFSDVETENSLKRLEIATGSTKQSTQELGTAQDVARFKHIGLEQATLLLTRAQTGSQRAMKELGLEVQATTDAQDKVKLAYEKAKQALDAQFPSKAKMTQAERDHYDQLRNNLDMQDQLDKQDAKIQDHQRTGKEIIAQLTEKVHGQADAYSQTAAGGMAEFKVQMEHLQATVGEKLIPVLTKLLGWLNDSVLFIEAHWPQISAVFHQVATNVQNAWENVGQPTFEAIRSVVRTTVDVVEALWRTFGGTIKAVISNDIGAVEDVFRGVVQTIRGVFNLIDDLIHGRWSQLWGDAKQIVSGVFTVIEGVLEGAVKNVGAIAGRIGSALKDGFVGALSGIGHALVSVIESAVNLVIGRINATITAINDALSITINSHIPGIGKIHLDAPNIPTIPTLDTGGYVARTGLAVVHEGEQFSGVGRGGGLGGVLQVHFNGDIYGGDPRIVGQQIADGVLAAINQRRMFGGGGMVRV